MAEGIRSVFNDPNNIASGAPTLRAVSVHEHKQKTPVAQLRQVELPIRWVEGIPLRDLRCIADHTGNNLSIFNGNWTEYSGQWITEGGGRLSEAGMILTRVL